MRKNLKPTRALRRQSLPLLSQHPKRRTPPRIQSPMVKRKQKPKKLILRMIKKKKNRLTRAILLLKKKKIQ